MEKKRKSEIIMKQVKVKSEHFIERDLKKYCQCGKYYVMLLILNHSKISGIIWKMFFFFLNYLDKYLEELVNGSYHDGKCNVGSLKIY